MGIFFLISKFEFIFYYCLAVIKPFLFYIYFFVAREFDWYNMFGGIFVLMISLYRAKFCKCAKNTWKESTLIDFLNVGYLLTQSHFLCYSSLPCIVFTFAFFICYRFWFVISCVSYLHWFLLIIIELVLLLHAF